MEKRHEMTWIPGGCVDHNDCNCDLKVTFPSLEIPDIIVRRYLTRKRTVAEMYSEVKAQIISQYYLVRTDEGGSQVKRRVFDDETYLDYMREYYTSSSQIPIEPPFIVSNTVARRDAPISTKFRFIYEEVEKQYWNRTCPIYNSIVIDKPDIGPPSLQAMCKQRLSWVETVYEPLLPTGHRRVIHTKENMGIEKALRLYSDFCTETTMRTPEDLQIFKYVRGALSTLLMQTGIPENFGKLTLKYEPHKLAKAFSPFKSGGISPGGTSYVRWGNSSVRVTSQGAKAHQLEASLRKLHSLLHTIKTNPQWIAEAVACIIKTKDEYKYAQFKTTAELDALLQKIREFFIPSQWSSMLSFIVNELRSKMERNNIIRIGMTIWHGGTYFLYKFLNGDAPPGSFYYHSGDITGLDKRMADWMQLLYGLNIYPYFKMEGLSEAEIKFTEDVLLLWATNLSAKMACHVGGFWRYMQGVMPSGCKETSTGDSWIMAFIFYTFCEHTKAQHPEMAALIDRYLEFMLLVIVVYGDDHIWACPARLHGIMNNQTWKEFLWTYYRMELRDEVTSQTLLSEIDEHGRFKSEATKRHAFLKVYFIENKDPRYAPVLPFKPIDEQIIRTMVSEFDTFAEQIAVLIGQMWDTKGTNVEACRVITEMYVAMMATNPKTPQELLQELDIAPDQNRVKRLIKKVNLTREEFYKFPSREQLMARHVVDGAKADYHYKYVDEDDVYDIDYYDDENIHDYDFDRWVDNI